MENQYYYYLTIFLVLLPIFYKYFFNLRKNNLPPSPLALPVIGHLYLMKNKPLLTLTLLSAKYGPVLYLRYGSRPVLIVSSPSAVEECFTKNDVIFANRPRTMAGRTQRDVVRILSLWFLTKATSSAKCP